VSDDGRLSGLSDGQSKDPAGVGYGIFVYDVQKAQELKP